MANDLLTLIHPNGLAARVAVLGKHAVKTWQTIRPPVPHDVSLSPELEIALETRKVLHVPRSPLGLGALVGEYDLRDRLAILAVWMTPPHNGGAAARVPGFQTVRQCEVYLEESARTSSQAEHLGFMVSAWCLPQNSLPSL